MKRNKNNNKRHTNKEENVEGVQNMHVLQIQTDTLFCMPRSTESKNDENDRSRKNFVQKRSRE